MSTALTDDALDTLFRNARSQNGWQDRAVSDDQLRAIYALMKWGPTSANQSPARFVFLRTAAAKARIKPFLLPSNVDKVITAPAVAIIGHDLAFYEHLPRLFPHNPAARDWFAGAANQIAAATSAVRNGTLQGAYLMIAARALGLDCGPMSGFDNAGVDREFFAGTAVKSNFICGLGHGDATKIYARSPRFEFNEVCSLL